jgi:hypothetical protein
MVAIAENVLIRFSAPSPFLRPFSALILYPSRPELDKHSTPPPIFISRFSLPRLGAEGGEARDLRLDLHSHAHRPP